MGGIKGCGADSDCGLAIGETIDILLMTLSRGSCAGGDSELRCGILFRASVCGEAAEGGGGGWRVGFGGDGMLDEDG